VGSGRQGTRRQPGRRRVLFFVTYDPTVYQRIAVLEEGFRAHGDEIVTCNAPLRLRTNARVRMLRRPWTAYLLVVAIVRCPVRLAWQVRRIRHVDVVVVGYMGQFDVHLARFLFPRVPDHARPPRAGRRSRRVDRCRNPLTPLDGSAGDRGAREAPRGEQRHVRPRPQMIAPGAASARASRK
jgi:hypothetical protein